MTYQRCLGLVAAVMVAACASTTPEQQIIRDAASALGGAERLQAVRTLVVEGQGTHYNLGQDIAPGAATQTYEVTQYRRAIDIPAERARTELVRVPKFNYWQGLAPQRQVQGVDKSVGYNVATNGNASRTAADDRRAELLRHPLTAVRAALDPAAQLTNARIDKGESLVDVRTSDGRAFTLAIDPSTKLPVRVITPANNVNLGDVLISTTFADYQNAGGLQLPTRLTTKTDDFTTAEIRVTKQAIDADTGDLAAPANVASASPPVPQ